MVEFIVVGMRYLDDHKFSANDIITLETDDNNKFDPKAVKVLVSKKHVAFVSRDNTIFVRQYMSEDNEVSFVQSYPASARLCIKLNDK